MTATERGIRRPKADIRTPLALPGAVSQTIEANAQPAGPIESGVIMELGVAHNQVLIAKQGPGGGNEKEVKKAMAALLDVLANQPGAIDKLLNPNA